MSKNTAENHKYSEQDVKELKQMSDINHQAFANTIWDDPQKAITIHKFWETFSHDKSNEVKHVAELEMRRIETILLEMTTTNEKFYGTHASAYIDAIGVKPKDIDDKGIEEVLPKTESKTVVDVETSVVEEQQEKGVKTVSLFNGQDMGDKPNQQDISKAAKQLLADDREEDAIALAKQYLGTGNYTPKKPGAKTQEWKDKAIVSWIKSLKDGLSKSTPEVEQPKVENQSADEMFGTTRNSLEAEQHAFKNFAKRYVMLALKGSEDAITAEKLSNLFFENREYNDAQIQVWKETVTKNDESSVLDHFAVLGAPGTDDHQLIILDATYEDLNARIYDMMQEIQITKDRLDDKQEYMVEEIGRKLYDELINTTFSSESGGVYEMYTKLHYINFIERVVTANFTKLDSPVTTNKEVGQATGEASKSKEGVESNIESDQKTAMEKLKKKSNLGTSIKSVTQTIISNGGIVNDIVDNPAYNDFFGEEHKFTKRNSMEKHIKENFDAWKEEYLNSLTSFPMAEFQRIVDTAYFNEVKFDDIIEQVKKLLIKPDGKILDLVIKPTKENKTEVVTVLTTEKDIKDYVSGIYKRNKSAESVKEAQKDVSEEGAESVSTEEKAAEQSSGEATKPVVESSNNVIVKVTHIECICNKAVKKNADLSFIMKDRKISELVEKGGAIIGPEKDTSVEYDLSADSTTQLHADLKKIYDAAVEKRRPKPNTGQKIIDKIKQITSPNKDEESKKEEAKETISSKGEESVEEQVEENNQESKTIETESSAINSLNDIKPVGLKLMEEGGSKQDLLKWGQDNLLNRQMKEQDENAIFKSADAVDTFMKGMFSDFFKEETPEETKNKKTVDDLKAFIIAASKEEGATYIKVCKLAKDYLNENDIKIKKDESTMFDLVRENAAELHKTHLEKQSATREESQEKIFVPEKLSETNTTVWDKVKDFKTLGEIYAIALELCDAGDWQQALNITTELIKSGNIESTDNWTDDMITQWFDINVLKKEVVKAEAPIVKEVENLDDNFKALQNANGGKSFRNCLIQILSNEEDTPELRKKIVNTIKGSKANYGRKMAKSKEDVLQSKINAAKALTK